MVQQYHPQTQQSTSPQQMMPNQQLMSNALSVPPQYTQLYNTPDLPPGFKHLIPLHRPPVTPPEIKPKKGTKMKTQHDRWYNMNEIVVENITQTALWKNEIFMSLSVGIDEWRKQVDKNVKDLDPITLDKLPSPAWCYLYWLCLLAPTQEDVEESITPDQPPIVRGVIFL